MSDILVSINCLTYNQENIISDAIESFLAQKLNFNYEILIGDDCSIDNTSKVVEDYIKKYPGRIKLISSDRNVGYIKNSRRLHENSKGKYIAICDGDDFWIDPLKLQKQVDYMEKHPNCTMCFHAAKIVNYERKLLGTSVRPSKNSKSFTSGDLAIGGGGFFPTSSLLYPKKIMDNPPSWYFDSSVGDYPLALILSHHGYAYYIDEFMSVYRTGVIGSWTSELLSGENITKNKIDNNKGDIEILENFNNYSDLVHMKDVDRAILIRKLYLSIYQREKEVFRENKYKEILNSMGMKRKMKILLLYYFPSFSLKLSFLYSTYLNLKCTILAKNAIKQIN